MRAETSQHLYEPAGAFKRPRAAPRVYSKDDPGFADCGDLVERTLSAQGWLRLRRIAWRRTSKLRVGADRSPDENNSPTHVKAWASHGEPVLRGC
jgi:hypothetical protein